MTPNMDGIDCECVFESDDTDVIDDIILNNVASLRIRQIGDGYAYGMIVWMEDGSQIRINFAHRKRHMLAKKRLVAFVVDVDREFQKR